jgi:CBS domain-containing protein
MEQGTNMKMQVRDVMTRNVISIGSDRSVPQAAQLMLDNRISGLPVVDADGWLIGIVSEGDFLRRGEIGTPRQRPRWLEFLLGPGRLAQEYVHSSGRRVEEVMTPDPYTVTEDDSLESAVEVMERRKVKRLPVLRGGRLVGILSRADLVRALADYARSSRPVPDDRTIRDRILSAVADTHWAPRIDVGVHNGVVELSGVITDERERRALIVVAENVAGVKQVHDHLVWVEPMSGTAIASPEDEAMTRTGNPARPAAR